MTVDDLTGKYSNNEAAAAVMSVLRRVYPQYMWGGGVADLLKNYESCSLSTGRLFRTLHRFYSDGIVEIKDNIDLEQRIAIRQALVDEGKIKQDDIYIITGPQDMPAEYNKMWNQFAESALPGYRLTDLGLRLPVFMRKPEKESEPIHTPVPVPI